MITPLDALLLDASLGALGGGLVGAVFALLIPGLRRSRARFWETVIFTALADAVAAAGTSG